MHKLLSLELSEYVKKAQFTTTPIYEKLAQHPILMHTEILINDPTKYFVARRWHESTYINKKTKYVYHVRVFTKNKKGRNRKVLTEVHCLIREMNTDYHVNEIGYTYNLFDASDIKTVDDLFIIGFLQYFIVPEDRITYPLLNMSKAHRMLLDKIEMSAFSHN